MWETVDDPKFYAERLSAVKVTRGAVPVRVAPARARAGKARRPPFRPCHANARRSLDCLRDVFFRIRHYHFSWHLFSIDTRHATCFAEHLAGFF